MGLSFRVALSSFALAAALGAVGCESEVVLGTECPGTHGACRSQDTPLTPRDAGGFDAAFAPPAPVDAGQPEAVADAAGAPSAPDAGLPAWVGVQNASFELTTGSTGDLTTLSGNEVSPWQACQPVGAGSSFTTGLRVESSVDLPSGAQGSGSPAVTVKPTDGSYFIGASFLFSAPLPIPLVQELGQPLQAGVRYAFGIDVRSATSGRNFLLLEAWGENGTCTLDKKLYATQTLMDGSWQRICIAFTPDKDYTQFVLKAGLKGTLTSAFTLNAQLFFDNMGPDPNCR